MSARSMLPVLAGTVALAGAAALAIGAMRDVDAADGRDATAAANRDGATALERRTDSAVVDFGDAPALVPNPARGTLSGDTVATFSILGYDPATGELGGAVQSRVFSVGNGVLWAEAGVGAVATQAIVDVSYGPQAIELLREGVPADEVVRRVWEADPDPRPDDWTKQGRQFAVVDAQGRVAAFTGPQATEWAGHRSCAAPHHCTAQGNILAGEAVVDEMVRAYQETAGHISLRLQAALEAGQAAGGDRRGMQSAAMLIVQEDGGVWLNNDVVLRLQVDDHEEPIRELRRLVEIAARQRERIRR